MAYVKLDCGLLDSTLWIEREAREVFITALLMATPVQFTEPIPQIDVRSTKPTGWCAAPGWYGLVQAAGPGIARRAGVDTEVGLCALERLGSPDPESRTPDHEGRRMIRIDGGYLILNFDRYRKKDHTAAARSARYRDRKAAQPTDHRHAVTGRSVTQAEAEAEAYKPPSSLREEAPPSKPRGRSLGKPLPGDFTISPAIREWATKNGFEPYLQAHLEFFVDYAKGGAADGKQVFATDWEAKFRNAIRQDWGDVRKRAQGLLGKAAGEKPWYITKSGIEAKAVELKLAPFDENGAEVFAQWANRVRATAGVTHEMVEMAKKDFTPTGPRR